MHVHRSDANMKPLENGVLWLEKVLTARRKLHEGEIYNEADRRYFVLTEIVQLLRHYPGETSPAQLSNGRGILFHKRKVSYFCRGLHKEEMDQDTSPQDSH